MDVRKPVLLNRGLLLGLLIALIPGLGWIGVYDFSGLEVWEMLAVVIAKVGAFAGMSLFALSLIISSKTVLLDKFFGGLDKMYATHRVFGTVSVFLLVLHPIALSVLAARDGLGSAALLWFDITDFGILLGSIALYSLVGIVFWSVYANVKHEKFVQVHRILGIVFLVGALHAFAKGSMINASDWLRNYLFILTIVSAVFFTVYTLLNDILQKPYVYTVGSIRKKSDNIIELILEPTSRIIRFSPGQFAYIRFFMPEMEEFHPFSIASGTSDRQLRFVIRTSGDFTRGLKNIKKGNNVEVKGPYGGFTFSSKKYKKQLWIAGGIGVTPFLSKARSLPIRHHSGMIEMIYATGDKNPYGHHELQQIKHNNPQFNITLFHQSTHGFVNLKTLIEHYKDVHERAIFVCGPPPLLNAVKDEAEKLGMSHQLYFEEFNY